MKGNFGMTSRDKFIVQCDLSSPDRGRINKDRIGRPNPKDTEERPVISLEDFEATRLELRELRRRMTPVDGRRIAANQRNLNRGWFDRERFENPNPDDTEERIVISREDIEATKQELRELRRSMTPKAS